MEQINEDIFYLMRMMYARAQTSGEQVEEFVAYPRKDCVTYGTILKACFEAHKKMIEMGDAVTFLLVPDDFTLFFYKLIIKSE